jgi:hypothetical protein
VTGSTWRWYRDPYESVSATLFPKRAHNKLTSLSTSEKFSYFKSSGAGVTAKQEKAVSERWAAGKRISWPIPFIKGLKSRWKEKGASTATEHLTKGILRWLAIVFWCGCSKTVAPGTLKYWLGPGCTCVHVTQ